MEKTCKWLFQWDSNAHYIYISCQALLRRTNESLCDLWDQTSSFHRQQLMIALINLGGIKGCWQDGNVSFNPPPSLSPWILSHLLLDLSDEGQLLTWHAKRINLTFKARLFGKYEPWQYNRKWLPTCKYPLERNVCN